MSCRCQARQRELHRPPARGRLASCTSRSTTTATTRRTRSLRRLRSRTFRKTMPRAARAQSTSRPQSWSVRTSPSSAEFPLSPLALGDQLRVVEFRLVAQDVRVGVGGHGQVALPDELGDPRPRHAPQVEQRDPTMTQIVRRPERDPARLARLRDRRPQRVGSARARTAVRRGRDPRGASSDAPIRSSSPGDNSTQSALRVLVVADRSRIRWRRSS